MLKAYEMTEYNQLAVTASNGVYDKYRLYDLSEEELSSVQTDGGLKTLAEEKAALMTTQIDEEVAAGDLGGLSVAEEAAASEEAGTEEQADEQVNVSE